MLLNVFNNHECLTWQVGHTNPGSLVVKFAKYENKGRTVNELQRATVREEDYDIAFTKEYFDQARSAAVTLGDVLMRTIIVANHPDWSTEKEDAVNHLQKVSMPYYNDKRDVIKHNFK